MEITKQTENFTLKDTTDVYEINGHITRENNGAMNVHFNITKLDGEHIGDCYYNLSGENNKTNFGVSCDEVLREEVTVCADTVVDSVLAHFKSNI